MTNISLKYRRSVLVKIKNLLIVTFGDNISSAIVYGSTLNEDFCEYSDYDILVVVKNPDIVFLKKLKEIKNNFLKDDIVIDFNVHNIDDIPKKRKKLFWHNNRSLYVQKEFDLYGSLLIGKNPFSVNKIDNFQMLKEAIKVINSLNYQARKLIVNRDLNNEGKILMMKWCIYAALYALASKGVYPKNKNEALSIFNKYFNSPIKPKKFLYLKINGADKIQLNHIVEAYKFLSYLDKELFREYGEKKYKK